MREVCARFQSIIRSYDTKLIFIPDRQQTQRAEISLTDGTLLIACEYDYPDTGRTKYSYQWMIPDNRLIIRWDNAHDYPGLKTSPHHQHVGSEENIQPSDPMTLEKVLEYIAAQLNS